MPYNPKFVKEKEVNFLINVAWVNKKTNTVRWETEVFGKYLARMGNNHVVSSMEIMWPNYITKGASWLTPEVAFSLMDSLVEEERMIVHLMLFEGCRKIELQRMQISDVDFTNQRIMIRGKGHKGGKLRWVKFHPTMMEEMARWMEIRTRRATEYLQNHPGATIPTELLLYHNKKMGTIGGYKHTSIERIITKIVKRTGVQFSPHTLRKTFARNMWLAGVKVEVISSLLGHTDVRTTMKYLGIDQDDQLTAQNKLEQFQQNYMRKR